MENFDLRFLAALVAHLVKASAAVRSKVTGSNPVTAQFFSPK
jgi:hypothetical protein